MSSAGTAVSERVGDIADGPHVVTIGNFDGLHLGHQHLLQHLRAHAEERRARPLVVTFEPHPVSVLRPEPPLLRIVTPARKLQLLRAAGIDDLLVLEFNLAFAGLEPFEFLDYLVQRSRPVAILIGEGFRFGRGRSGSGDTLRAHGERHGYATETLAPFIVDGAPVSSSRVRRHILAGELNEAGALLGRRVRLSGVVRGGLARGRDMGYPTANLNAPVDRCVPCDGIYAAYARTSEHPTVARETLVYIGASPTFDPRERLIEAHILDFQGDLYASELELEFIEFLRPDQRFESAEELVAQIQLDEAAARRLFHEVQPEVESEARI